MMRLAIRGVFLLLCGTVIGCALDGSDDGLVEADAEALRCGASNDSPVPVIFDSDMDFDDTAALAYLAGLHQRGVIDLRAVTVTNNGAGLPGRGLLHARCMLAEFGLEHVPVADGSEEGLPAFPDWVRQLIDGIVSAALSDCSLAPEPSSVSAAELIASEVSRTRGRVTLLMTGPVSNVSSALELLPRSTRASRLSEVVTMGGAVFVPGELLEPNPAFDGTQTVNYLADPVAAQRLLDLTPPGRLTMVPHDATSFAPITFDFLERLATAAATPEAAYVSRMMSHPMVRAGLESGQPAFWWDPLAATAIVDAGDRILEYTSAHIDIVEDGPSAGRSMPVHPSRGTKVRVAVSADQTAFEDHFLDVLTDR